MSTRTGWITGTSPFDLALWVRGEDGVEVDIIQHLKSVTGVDIHIDKDGMRCVLTVEIGHIDLHNVLVEARRKEAPR